MTEDGKIAETTEVVPRRLLYPVEDVAVLLGGISERKVRTLIDEGRLPTKWIDGRRLVPHEPLMEFVDNLPDEPVYPNHRRRPRETAASAA